MSGAAAVQKRGSRKQQSSRAASEAAEAQKPGWQMTLSHQGVWAAAAVRKLGSHWQSSNLAALRAAETQKLG